MKIKRYIPVITTLCAAAVVCVGCATESDKEYDELNAKLKLNYSQIVLTVTDKFDEESVLTSEYTMTFIDGAVKINYSVERFSEISLDSAASEKTTLVGEAVAAGGNVVCVEGEEVNLRVLTSGSGLEFKNEYFDNVDLTGIYFMADVTNPSGFMGSSISCTDMKVKATFLEFFHDIQITYQSESGHQVEYLYAFTV